jgi:hypothetical protein
MPNVTIQGIIQDIKDVVVTPGKQDPSKSYYSRKFIVTENQSSETQYPQSFELECNGPTLCDSLEAYKIGDSVTCGVNLRGNIYQKDGVPYVFNKLQCWNIKKEGAAYQIAQPHQQASPQPMQANTFQPKNSLDAQMGTNAADDLPF